MARALDGLCGFNGPVAGARALNRPLRRHI